MSELKDFYFSKSKYEHELDLFRSVGYKDTILCAVLIDGKYKVFHEQVKEGVPPLLGYEDLEYIGTVYNNTVKCMTIPEWSKWKREWKDKEIEL